MAVAPREQSTTMQTYPGVDESIDRLRRAGWSVGGMARGPDRALVRLVRGTNGENRVEVAGASQAEAWHRATIQARDVGMSAKAGDA